MAGRKKVEEVVTWSKPANAPTDVPYYSEVDVLKDAHELVDLVMARQDAQAKVKALEAEIDDFTAGIEAMMKAAKVDSVGVSHYKVTRAPGRITRTLGGRDLLAYDVDPKIIAQAAIKVDGQYLLENGVPATTIKKATHEEQGAGYVLVTDVAKVRKPREPKKEEA